ncbi:MAG TPA: hypothetical protein VHB69_00245 [Mycobacteriales bacterium]|nr:hypothetical protein [Mycobacteriales bacterium]
MLRSVAVVASSRIITGVFAVAGADAEVVHASGAADGDRAVLVDVVEADPEVLVGLRAARKGFRGGLVGRFGGQTN